MEWEKRSPRERPALRMTLKRTGDEIGPRWTPAPDDQPFSFDLVNVHFSPALTAERKAKREAFRSTRRAPKS
jgi:hypothetical protein